MFDFEKLSVFSKLKFINSKIYREVLKDNNLDFEIKNQLKRASLSAVLNLAEGSGRELLADKKHFYVIAKASLLEVAAILIIIDDLLNTNDVYSLKEICLESVKCFQDLLKPLNENLLLVL